MSAQSSAIVLAQGLSKTYRIAEKQPGLKGTFRHLLRRRYRDLEAVKGIHFAIEEGDMVGLPGAKRCWENHHLENAERTHSPERR